MRTVIQAIGVFPALVSKFLKLEMSIISKAVLQSDYVGELAVRLDSMELLTGKTANVLH